LDILCFNKGSSMPNKTQVKQAELFQEMHHKKKILVLPNVWDAGGAIIFEKQGFEAVGTTSAGISYSLGYPDGENITFDDILDNTTKIAKRASIALSVDVERGYGTNTQEIISNITRIIQAGAVGINIEDGILSSKEISDMGEQAKLIKEIRKIKQNTGINFVINARTDIFWLGVTGSKEELLEKVISRANVYLEAGADCIFVPGLFDRQDVQYLVKKINGPLNLIATATSLSIEELEDLGVSRFSTGSGPVRASFALINSIASELKNEGTLNTVFQNSISYDELNTIFE